MHHIGLIEQPLTLLLKTSPLIDELALYDVVNTPGVATDLSHISTIAVWPRWLATPELTCQKISGYLPKDDGMAKAFSGADIVVIPAGIPRA